jgi:hypothetical protein
MGRPRSKNRMSRMVQARVTDEQYNWLYYRAVEFHDGDLSQAIRESINFAEAFAAVLDAESPPEALTELLERWERQYEESRGEVFMDGADDT